MLRTTPPDLLIADVRLGPFNGLQLVISSPKPIPAIIITGFADPVLESDARRRGADYVLKPISPARLLDLVAQKLTAAQPGFGTPRRWERKPVIGGLPINVDDAPARIVDVSYGGLRFEMQRTVPAAETSSLSITLPSAQMSVKAKLVWEKPHRRREVDVRRGPLPGNARVARSGGRDLDLSEGLRPSDSPTRSLPPSPRLWRASASSFGRPAPAWAP